MKRLSVLFIVLLLFCSPTFSQKREPGKVKTVVIDPGHGGAKPGAIGKRAKEKTIVLSVAKKVGKLITDNYPDVKVIYTRTTDVDIALSERAHIANRAKADLFISIHANSHPTGTPTGVETFVAGLSQSKANMEIAKKENADILLEDDYKTNAEYQGFDPNSPESYVMFAMYQNAYRDKSLNLAQYIQNQYKSKIKTIDRGVKQAEFMVLYKTTMPSVLTEIGFISNPAEEAFMMSDEGQGTIAECIFRAFAKYKAAEESTAVPLDMKIDLPGYGVNKPKEQPAADSAAKVEEQPAVAETPAPAQPAKPTPKVDEQKNDEDDAPYAVVKEKPAAPKADQVCYRVQFMTTNKVFEKGASELRGIDDFDRYKQKESYYYVTGHVATIKEAKEIQKQVQERGFKDAFVVAYYQGRRISLQQAREMSEENK